MSRSLWFTSDPAGYYLIPDHIQLPAGTTTIQSLTDEKTTTNVLTLAPYKVSQDEARAFIDTQLDSAAAETRVALDKFLAFEAVTDPSRIYAPGQEPVTREKSEAFAKDLLGFTAQDVEDDLDLVEEKVEELFSGIGSFLQDLLSGDPAGLANAQTKLTNLETKLNKHAIPTPDGTNQWLTDLHSQVHENQVNYQESTAQALEELAQVLQEGVAEITQALGEQAQNYRAKKDEGQTAENG